MMRPASLLAVLLLALVPLTAAAGGGRWDLLNASTGVSAMHMQLLHNDHVIIFDRTDFGRSNISLPDGKCRNDPNDKRLKVDCTAHSIEYDVATGAVRPLMILTDTWCSSGAVDPDGHLVQTGGWNDGERVVRTIYPSDGADWKETPQALAVKRWYASNQILPEGRAILVGGRHQPNYEFFPESPSSSNPTPIFLRFLVETRDVEENNLYPFTHLNVDGNLFIFANNRAILFDYTKNVIVRKYPNMPGGDPRNYPSTGSSVLLPIKPAATEAEVLICGGAPTGSYLKVNSSHNFLPALSTCGRIKITDAAPAWSMETMPTPRVMGDMLLLPSGEEVLIINGAAKGAAGWENAQEPVMTPVTYRPEGPVGGRFSVQNASSIPRLYHSTAILLRDGRVLVGGSNPHEGYVFRGVQYPTELSLEAFSPDYLAAEHSNSRPKILSSSPMELKYGTQFKLRFSVGNLIGSRVSVTMVAPSFATHSFSMNQRLLILDTGAAANVGASTYEVAAAAPNSAVLAPPGYYLVYVVNSGIPSEGIWVHIQ